MDSARIIRSSRGRFRVDVLCRGILVDASVTTREWKDRRSEMVGRAN